MHLSKFISSTSGVDSPCASLFAAAALDEDNASVGHNRIHIRMVASIFFIHCDLLFD
jgi:hypothetical protein